MKDVPITNELHVDLLKQYADMKPRLDQVIRELEGSLVSRYFNLPMIFGSAIGHVVYDRVEHRFVRIEIISSINFPEDEISRIVINIPEEA